MESEEASTREIFASKLGFILMSAGCAIGLGNIWRFPYITGQYGGGFFVLLYLIFLVLLGFPILLLELAIGRGGRSTMPGAYKKLKSPESRFPWEKPSYVLFAGNLILLMFYTAVSGWLLYYGVITAKGSFANIPKKEIPRIFGDLLADPTTQILYMGLMLLLTVIICMGGIKKTVEKAMKWMMGGLFLLLIILVIKAVTLPNAWEGVKFFLKPDWQNFAMKNFGAVLHGALSQAFFTLSIGIGSITVCGSYMQKEQSIAKEGLWIVVLDTLMAIFSGILIFSCCASFAVDQAAGPSLIFVTLPHVFRDMAFGRFWGTIFFIFLSIAALSTLVAVFENLVSFLIDQFSWKRKNANLLMGAMVFLFSLPCIFGFNLWKNIQPFGKNSTILDLEDFVLSNNLLPLGALYLTIFCTSRYGWGLKNTLTELGIKKELPYLAALYVKWGIPLIILIVYITGLIKFF